MLLNVWHLQQVTTVLGVTGVFPEMIRVLGGACFGFGMEGT
jgi:hypothetical protein